MGVVQFYVDEREEVNEEEYVDLTDDEFSLLGRAIQMSQLSNIKPPKPPYKRQRDAD